MRETQSTSLWDQALNKRYQMPFATPHPESHGRFASKTGWYLLGLLQRCCDIFLRVTEARDDADSSDCYALQAIRHHEDLQQSRPGIRNQASKQFGYSRKHQILTQPLFSFGGALWNEFSSFIPKFKCMKANCTIFREMQMRASMHSWRTLKGSRKRCTD